MDSNQPNITDWLQTLFTLIGGGFALYLWRKSNIEKKKQFSLELYDKFYGDADIRKVIYYVDSGPLDNSISYQGPLEKEADKTIRYLDHIGSFLKNGSLNKREVRVYRYEIRRLLENEEMRNYIEWLRTIGVALENLNYLDL